MRHLSIRPEQGIRRFYSPMIERDLFGTVRLVRNWGRIGTNRHELVEIDVDELAAGQALEMIASEAAAWISGFVTQMKKPRPVRAGPVSPRLRSAPKAESVGHAPATVSNPRSINTALSIIAA
jgi:predicted DNA-binding WGR domain protein